MSGRSILRAGVATTLMFCWLTAVSAGATAQEITDNEGGLTVTPRRGPIGTTVTLRGNGCENVAFMGGGVGGAINGADPLPEIALDGAGGFEVRYTIPARLEPVMGEGGGRPTPGTYFFRSFPPRCYATFVVTGLASTGPNRASLAALAVLGGLLVAAGWAMIVSARSGPEERPPVP